MRPHRHAADALLALVSRDWAGLPVALLLAAVGGWCAALGPTWTTVLGGVLLGLAVLTGAGSLRHLRHVARVLARYPAPGRLVDVGGHRMHVLAEGRAGGRPTVVWMPGGHSPGHELHHLHAALREETRSVLVDRPGSGWSDIGPFPRTTATEADELLTALEKAGERGPFVLVGHSLGGLLVANAARRRPDLVAALVLLDPTPPDVITYGPSTPLLARSRSDSLRSALRCLFGIHGAGRKSPSGEPGEPDEVLRALASRARSGCATASIYRELSPTGMAEVGWQTMVYDGDLGDLPVVLVTPGDLTGGEEALNGGHDATEAERLRRFYLATRSRFLATSTAARRICTPAGTGHNFPHEAPEFVVGVVRTVLGELHKEQPEAGAG
ncbi:alpha/beta fold hydrolase [Peterkaempfera bronchialis]|nr:alpha/beta hydrolase [Peterkaempfera bronchialis]